MNTEFVLKKIKEKIKEFGYFANYYGGNFTSIEQLLLAFSNLDKRESYETRVKKIKNAAKQIHKELQTQYTHIVPRNNAEILDIFLADDVEIYPK